MPKKVTKKETKKQQVKRWRSDEFAMPDNFQDSSLEKLRDEKFGNNTFAKKYKESLDDFRKYYTYGADWAGEDTVDSTVYAWQNAEQVKSWSKHERAEALDKAAVILMAVCVGVIIGVAVTNL